MTKTSADAQMCESTAAAVNSTLEVLADSPNEQYYRRLVNIPEMLQLFRGDY